MGQDEGSIGGQTTCPAAEARASLRLCRTGARNRTVPPATPFLRQFREDLGGVVAVETGLLALPLLMLITGVIVIGFMAYCHAVLDYATQRASRNIMIGIPQTQNMDVGTFSTQLLCPSLPNALFDCSKVTVNLDIVPETAQPTRWGNYVKPDQSGLLARPLGNGLNNFCLGAGNSYQILQVLYPLPVYLSLFSSAPNVSNNQYVIMSTAAFKNEPFQGGTVSSSGC